MATVRSRLPSRLRQLFSSEGSFGPSLQLDSEPPPQIRAFIDKVIKCPLQDITIPLSGFKWEYNKGNFHHWRPLFHHFDTYFKTYLACRNDMLLSDHITGDDPFPKHAVMQILRVMQIILENCHNRSSFDGLEHFKLLLASTDPEVLIASLETLCALVKIHPSKLHVSGKLIGLGSVNSHLLSLAQGWGSKEEGLGLYSCVVENEKSHEEGLPLFPQDAHNSDEKPQYRLGSTLYFELHGVSPQRSGESSSSASSVSSAVIQMPDLHVRKEEDLLLLKQCLDQYNVPQDQRFSLLTRIRYAHAFRSPRTCRLYSRICLLSFIVLVQSNDANDELVSFFANETEYTNELIQIVRSEDTVSGTIRTLAMLALGAHSAAYIASHDRARILGGSSVNLTGGNRMILLNVLQKAILSLNNFSDPSSLAFVEALLQFYLLQVVSTSNSGNIIRGSGMVPTFLPLLEDSDPSHMHLVCYAVKTLQKLMDYSSAALNLFRDLGGVELLAHRLQVEVQRLAGLGGLKSESSSMIAECSVDNSNDHLIIQKRLIRALLKTLGSATYAPTNASGSFNPHDSALPSTLTLIFGNVDKFGGDIYCSAVTVMSEILHKDPTCFSALHELGLPNAFLSSVAAGIYPSSKALTCIPSGIGAICLNNKGLEAVKEASALRFLVDTFTSRKYTMPMNEAVVPLANAVEELLRHVASLRETGVDIIIEIVNKIASFGEGGSLESLEKANGNAVMDMDSGEGGSDTGSSLVTMADSSVERISDEQFIHLSIFHLMVLLHRTMENSETCRLFVEKSGIVVLLKLLLRPSIIQSSEGMAIALHSTLVFKGFTQHHAAPLARAFCSALREHLKKTLTEFSLVSGALLDPKSKPDSGAFPSLFLVEFLLFLAASKENRWLNALLTEFAGDGKDVLEDIGRVHREILWQIALLEDSKLDVLADSSVSQSESQQLASVTSGPDQQRFTSFRQFLDPLTRRRMSGWSMESQYFDLLNLYRDLGRASGTQQQHNSDTSSVRYSSNIQLNQSGSADADGIAMKEEEKQRAYYTSCCDMVRSLSLHILHMFQELGKVMLVPSRRRDDTLNVSPSSKTVGATFAAIALEHMNFDGHTTSGSEALVSKKCRYLGKVIDFVDGILMDRHDSCNPILLNCSYGLGVIQSVLTTFQATSQLLFAINRSPTSPMDTDNATPKQAEKDLLEHSWIYGPLSSYGKLMDHLVTSTYILSPFTKYLLVQPLADGHVQFPKDAETFVKVLQSMVLKNVLPVWTHPQFVDCGYDFIGSIISIICHVYSGVEVKNVDISSGDRIPVLPPNDLVISSIAEMGFSRSRAEEALRQVGANSVELAMDWLFSHPEEIQEDDELARALAMSLGNSGSDSKEDGNESIQHFEEEMIQLPPIDQLLSTCVKLLQTKESLAFPVRDLLVMICSRDDGQNRSNIITFIIDQIKSSSSASDAGKDNALSALFHVLALMLHEDTTLRDIACKNGLVDLASDLLYQWDLGSSDEKKEQFPKWIATAFLAVDQLLQVDKKLNPEIVELLKKNSDNVQQNAVVIDGDRQNKAQSAVESSPQQVNSYHEKRLLQVACSCIRKQLPSETIHAVLQLCATLTRNHSLAVNFLDIGGLPLLLNLPASCMFSSYDNVATAIIRHILEDPQTLKQAMESEIKHSFISAANRHSSGRLTPRSFLSNLTSVISRDPMVFMRAAQSVCQVEMVGDRPYVVLLKDRDKDRSKDKEKEKDKPVEKEKAPVVDGKAASGSIGSAGVVIGRGKVIESNKNTKPHRKPPNSFVCVIEHLLDLVSAFEPPLKGEANANVVSDIQTVSEMDIDATASKGKGKAVASTSDSTETNQESASLAKVVFILKLLTEILMTYSASVHILLRKDAEVSRCRVPLQLGSNDYSCGGIFHHTLHKFVPHAKSSKKERKLDSDWKYKLATRASQFLVASCLRSAEARKRVFTEVNFAFHEFVQSARGFMCSGHDLQAFTDLLNDIMGARSLTGISISAEAAGAFIEAGLVRTLTQALQVLDLDQSESSKLVTGIIKALETVTKEHLANIGKGDTTAKASDNSQREYAEHGDAAQLGEAGSLEQNLYAPAVHSHTEPFSAVQTYGGSEAVTDEMEHDQDLGGFAQSNEDDYMNDTSEDARGLENGMDNVAIRYEIRPDGQDTVVDEEEDDEMSENEGEEDEDDEPNGLEEDEEHHLSHPDTDNDEIDEEGFEEEVLDEMEEMEEEEEEEEEEEDEDGMLLRLEQGINGTLNVMPVEVFGSRRQGRSMSIYNLLGRTSNNTVPPQHPLLMESHASLSAPAGASDNARDIMVSDRNVDSTSSRLDTVVRYMRSGPGRQGYRFNLWADGNQASAVSSSSSLPQGLEDFLVSHLRQPEAVKLSDQITVTESENKSDGAPVQELDTIVRGEDPDENNADDQNNYAPTPSFAALDNSTNTGNGTGEIVVPHGTDAANMLSNALEMQLEPNDMAVRDVEAVSQESGGSGATLGESLRSLDVEIGSADGHDDAADRMPLAEMQGTRTRRTNASFGMPVTGGGRDTSLHSLSEIVENPAQETDQGVSAEGQEMNGDGVSGSIDPAFLDALPEELRAEVLSAQQGQVAQPSNSEQQNAGDDIDPEFLAALPPDIRAEVLAQQQAQRVHQSQELDGQPVEMDAVSIIATFPSDLREEVLLTSSDAVLANLPPALVAEANMLRERVAHRYRSRTLFGMYPRSRRGEPSRRGEGSSLDRVVGSTSHKHRGGSLLDAEGAPLVDSDALKGLIRLLQVFQPLYKSHLPRLLLNLCSHNESRAELVKILMEMLMLDTQKSGNQLTAAEPSYRLYACHSHVMYSRPQYSNGVPPLVLRRVLETLTYLARNHPSVAKVLLEFKLPQQTQQTFGSSEQRHGKAAMLENDDVEEVQEQEGKLSVALLLGLLNQPLYFRSIAHLEQLLNLLDVIIDDAGSKSRTQDGSGLSVAEQQSDPEASVANAEMNTDAAAIVSQHDEARKIDESANASTSVANGEYDGQSALHNLPQTELRSLCSLLAKEGLSDNAYVSVAEIVKKLATLTTTHSHLFITELASAVHNLTKSGMEELHMFSEAEKPLLQSTSSSGASILRVLQALSSLVASLDEKERDKRVLPEKDAAAAQSLIRDIHGALEPLWLELSSCICKIESVDLNSSSQFSRSKASTSMPPLPAGTQNILPYIESFFVTCEKIQSGQPDASLDFAVAAVQEVDDASTSVGKQTSGHPSKVDEKHSAFVKFSERHRKLLNAFIRQNPRLLEKSFSLMLKVPRFIDFDNKRSHFRSKVKHQHDHHHSSLRISVRRAYILEDSYNQLRMRSAQELKGRLAVHFQGEEGIDAGGLTREWYQVLSKVIFDRGALLFTTVGNDSTFQPNPNSVYQTEHLSYFKFVGRVVAKALFDGQLLDVHFTRSFYKHILGAKVTYHDIEAIDPDFYKNLKWMLENDISDVLDLTFSMDADEEKLILYEKTEVTDYELIPGGRNIKVTEENKHQYVDLVAEHRLTTAIRPQINAFLEGFNELISRELISIFNDKELELLISGLPDIDLDDMRANADYSGYSSGSPAIQWFWEVVQGFSKEEKARLLQFVTGTSKVPLEGFSALQGISGSQKFQIHKAYGSVDHLPTAHTCFNQLDLPEYPSKEHLMERLRLAIHEGNEGFGFG